MKKFVAVLLSACLFAPVAVQASEIERQNIYQSAFEVQPFNVADKTELVNDDSIEVKVAISFVFRFIASAFDIPTSGTDITVFVVDGIITHVSGGQYSGMRDFAITRTMQLIRSGVRTQWHGIITWCHYLNAQHPSCPNIHMLNSFENGEN
jgi:hypothetical protein